MKFFACVSAFALAAAVAAPALAGSGYLEAGYSRIDTSGPDLDRWHVGGAASTEINGGDWNVQGDAKENRLSEGGSSLNYAEGGAHVFWRDSRYAGGGYFNASDFEGAGFYGIGGEGKAFFPPATISGSIGYDWADMGGSHANGWDAALGVKFFATDNFTVDLGAGYNKLEDFKSTTWKIGAEFKPAAMPVSFFGEYRRHNIDNSGFFFVGDDINVYEFGLRWNFGSPTLKARDRLGPSMRTGSSFLNAIF